MTFLEVMQHRYTTKKYHRIQKIDDQQIEELKEILRLSPSSINSQPWKFIFVRDDQAKEKLSKVSKHNTHKVLGCDTVVVFSRINSIPRFEEQIEAELSDRVITYFREYIKPQPEEMVKAWFDRQLYLALGIFLAACAEMGIDSTPMEGIEPEEYDEILGLTDYASIVAVAIGRRDPEDGNQPVITPKYRRPIDKVVLTL